MNLSGSATIDFMAAVSIYFKTPMAYVFFLCCLFVTPVL